MPYIRQPQARCDKPAQYRCDGSRPPKRRESSAACPRAPCHMCRTRWREFWRRWRERRVSWLPVHNIAIGWRIEIEIRPDGDNPRRINPRVTSVVVPFDVLKIDGRLNIRMAVQLLGVAPQRWVADNRPAVAFEVTEIDRVKTNERGEEANVGFRQITAQQKVPLRQASFQPLERIKDSLDRRIIAGLIARKASLVHAIVQVRINARIDLIDLCALFFRIIIAFLGPKTVKRRIEHPYDVRRLVRDDRPLLLVPKDRNGHARCALTISELVELIKLVYPVHPIGNHTGARLECPAVVPQVPVNH